jgi:hypothetical protein
LPCNRARQSYMAWSHRVGNHPDGPRTRLYRQAPCGRAVGCRKALRRCHPHPVNHAQPNRSVKGGPMHDCSGRHAPATQGNGLQLGVAELRAVSGGAMTAARLHLPVDSHLEYFPLADVPVWEPEGISNCSLHSKNLDCRLLQGVEGWTCVKILQRHGLPSATSRRPISK